jgi:4'-phosphopantetheinyl transferase
MVLPFDEEAPSGSLGPGCVHIWCVNGEDIDDPALLRQGASDLTALEVARAERFVKREDRHRFIIGRWMLRRLLGKYFLGENSFAVPGEITFAIDQHGRPELVGPDRLCIQFNLSHTDGLVACAFTAGTPIGIDVERIRQSGFDMEVACNYFSAAACRDILHASADLRTERFFEYWVLMEAYAKARGTGLEHADGSFVFESSNRSRIRFVPARVDDRTVWNFWMAEPAPGYRMAVAVGAKPSRAPIVKRLRPDGSHNATFRILASTEAFQPT